MNERVPLLIVGLLILPLLAVAGSAQQKTDHRIYSNVQYVEEGAGDLVGAELELTLRGSEVNGHLRIYQGGCATPSVVRGTSVDGKLHLTGTDAAFGAGRIDIVGTLLESSFQGVLTLERGAAPEKVRLKRINEPHC